MGGGLESRCVGRVYGADGDVRVARHHPHPTHTYIPYTYYIHTYIHIYTYIHTHTYINAYTHAHLKSVFPKSDVTRKFTSNPVAMTINSYT